MSLEYDWTSKTYRSRLGDISTSINDQRSIETLADARYELSLVGLRLRAKIETRWPRIYRMLRAASHDPAQAAKILVEAQRKDDHARAWIKAVLVYERRDLNS